jgi:hypothetical protein
MEHNMTLEDIKTWREAQGKKELLAHQAGKLLSHKQAILAQCYQCNAGYMDGRKDCETPLCSLYGHMPYRKEKVKRERSEKQKANDAKAGLRLLKHLCA